MVVHLNDIPGCCLENPGLPGKGAELIRNIAVGFMGKRFECLMKKFRIFSGTINKKFR